MKDHPTLPQEFENIGKMISSLQLTALAALFSNQSIEQIENFSHIFKHLPPHIFKDWLKNCKEEEVSLLKKMAVFEPLQHQLTLLSHELEKELDGSHDRTTDLAEKIMGEQSETLSYKVLNEYLANIENLRAAEEELYSIINRTLLIAWNGERTDLIEKLTLLKEGCHRMLHEYLGTPRHQTKPPTGIYELLELHFGAAFGNPKDPQDDDSLKDDEPGIEALTKLNLWSLLDYNESGLLPEFDVTTWKGLKENEEKYRAYELEMHDYLAKHLDRLSLKTVGDFKKAHLYTKEMLKEFINERPVKLEPLRF